MTAFLKKNKLIEQNTHITPKNTELFGGKSESNRFRGSSLLGVGFETDLIHTPPPPVRPREGDEGSGGGNHLPELRSSEVNEVLSSPPSWLVRWGTTVFFGVMLLLFVVSWVVHYPDLVRGNLTIVAQNLPKSVVAKSEGKLTKLWVKDAQMVQKGQSIAFLESTANHEEVLTLAILTDSLVNFTQHQNVGKLYGINMPSYFNLGELQKSYQGFQETFIRVKSFVGNGMYLQKRQILVNDLASMGDLKNNLNNQLQSSSQDYALAEEEFNRQKGLLKGSYISKNEYNQLVTKVLSKKQSLEQMRNGIKSQEISQNQKKQEILALDKDITEQKNALT